MNKTGKIVVGVLCGLGTLFLIIGLVMNLAFKNIIKDRVLVDGVIVGFYDKDDHPLIAYTMDGRSFQYRSHSSDSSWKIGTPMKLYVDPEDGNRVCDNSLHIGGIVFEVIGLVLMAGGSFTSYGMGRYQRRVDALQTNGLRVRVTISDVKVNNKVQVMNRHPSRLWATCIHPVSNQRVTVHSQDLYKHHYQPGDAVYVLFDPTNEKRYTFDVQEDA